MRWVETPPAWLASNAPGKMAEYTWGQLTEGNIGGGRWEWMYYQAFKTNKNSPGTKLKCQVLLTYRVTGKWADEKTILQVPGVQKGIDSKVEGGEG